MAFKLTRADTKRRDEVTAKLATLADELGAAVETYNEAVQEAMGAVVQAAEAYNEALEEARELRDDLVGQWQDEVDEKSERWQEGDKAQAVQALIEEWEGLDLEDVHVDAPDELEAPDTDHADELEQASTEAGG